MKGEQSVTTSKTQLGTLLLAAFATMWVGTSTAIGAAACCAIPPAGPVCVKPPQSVEPSKDYRFQTPAGPIVAQTDADGKAWAWGRAIKDGDALAFKPSEWPATNTDAGVKIAQLRDGLIEVRIDGKMFTEFRYGKEDFLPYLWPVIGPTGQPVTRAFPMKEVEGERKDHPHHRSIWTAWGDVRVGDYTKPGSNYWHIAKEPARQDKEIVRRIVRIVSGPVFGEIAAEIDWTSYTGKREFSEVRTYRFYRGDEDNRMIEVRNVFRFDDGDVMFFDTKEAGTLSLRVATSMDEIDLDKKPGKGRIVNSRGGVGGGSGPENCWGRPAEWCDYVGPVDGQIIGIAVFDHPKNPGNRPPRWHIRDYGLYTVNPYSLKGFPDSENKDGSYTFKKGAREQFDYRILIHKGDTKVAKVADGYRLYCENPVAQIR